MMRGIAAALLATGCLSIPPYQPETSVSYTAKGTAGTVKAPGLELRFADGDGFHFPDRLAIDGTNVLGRDPAAPCFEQDEAGFLISPTPRISAHSEAMLVRNDLVPVLRGPAVVQVKLEWRTRFSCNLNRQPGGASTFTVFPDGRIVRHDVLGDAGSETIRVSDCTCSAGGAGFTITSYWTLARDSFRAFSTSDAPTPGPLPSPGQTLTNFDTACVDAGDTQVGFAWRHSELTLCRGGGLLIGCGRDMMPISATLDTYNWTNSTMMFVARGSGMGAGCPAVLKRADELAAPPPLTVNGTPWIASERDGIYGGDGGMTGEGDQPPAIPLETPRAELSGAVNGSFAVWLRFPREVADVRATLQGATGAWYLPQQVNDREWIVWFRDSLLAGQPIVVEPR